MMTQGRPEMRPRDGGLVAHGVRAMRDDEVAVVVAGVGDRWYIMLKIIPADLHTFGYRSTHT